MVDIKYLYKERKRIKKNNLGYTKMMMDVSTGEVWNDFFVDQNSYKIYNDENIIAVSVNDIIHDVAKDHIPKDDEIVEAIERWVSKRLKGEK